MNTFIVFFLTTLLSSNPEPAFTTANSDCFKPVVEAIDDKRDLIYAIEGAFSYIKKAMESETLFNMTDNARRAKNECARAKNEAADLDLDDIERECANAFNYCRYAEDARTTKNAIDYLQKAKKALQSAYKDLE